MSEELSDFRIPSEKQMLAIFDLLIENIASTFALQDFIFLKLTDMSGEHSNEKFTGFIQNQKKEIERYKTEIMTSFMSKYAEWIFSDENTCWNHLEKLPWNDKIICPFCKSEKYYKCSNEK